MSVRRRLVDFAGNILGAKPARPFVTLMAQAGLRGLGVNLNHDFLNSGESWLLGKMFAQLKGAVVLDVGANVGEYTLKARELGAGKVYAFEPSVDTCALLKQATASDNNIEVYQMALGEAEGTTSFFVPTDPNNSVFASRDVNVTPLNSDQMTSVTVPLTTVDAFVSTHSLSIDVMKVDVEGFELEVFKGAQKTIAERPPKLIHFEFNSHHGLRHQTIGDFAELLPEYNMFRLASKSLRPLDPSYYLSNIYVFQNIICLHPSATKLFAALT
jgi:FkbM family methyltransferase